MKEKGLTTEADWAAAEVLWDYNQLHHELRPAGVAIALGCHDLGVATFAAKLYHANFFPALVFSGANSPTTLEEFPRGEAIHFRERAIELGVSERAILLESRATNTGENLSFSRQVLQGTGFNGDSVILISMPYMERRVYATCRKVWPQVEPICTSESVNFKEYVESMGNARLVIDHMVGDTQRVIEYPRLGFAIPQEVPEQVYAAYQQLLGSGFTSRIIFRS